jgi:hypothetical protein
MLLSLLPATLLPLGIAGAARAIVGRVAVTRLQGRRGLQATGGDSGRE